MSNKGLWTPNSSTDQNRGGFVTATQKGTKRPMDVNAIGGSPAASVEWDSFLITDNTLTDVVTFYTGGLGGTLVATFTATYTSSRKKTLVSGVWT